MGEIADMMMEGGMCEWCGACFREDHGYPVLCWDCYDKANKEDRKGHQRALQKDG